MTTDKSDGSDSDYVVENFIHPDKVSRIPTNDETADILGNFDNSKRDKNGDLLYPKDILSEENNSNTDGSDNDEDYSDELDENLDLDTKKEEKVLEYSTSNPLSHTDANFINSKTESSTAEKSITIKNPFKVDSKRNFRIENDNKKLTRQQIDSLLRGVSKSNRYVLYVTNLNFKTTKDDLQEYFSQVGHVKSIRIPKSKQNRKGGFAFIEMSTIDDFQNALQLHNNELHGRSMKIQVSEGGKKKSANKKNILKQKNRKLAEMRNEQKSFTRSGKNYDRSLKKEKAKEFMKKTKWRK